MESNGWTHNEDWYSFNKGNMSVRVDILTNEVSVLCTELTAPIERVVIEEDGSLSLQNPLVIVNRNSAEDRIRILRRILDNIHYEGDELENTILYGNKPFDAGYKHGIWRALQELDKLEDAKVPLMNGNGNMATLTTGEEDENK